MDNNQEENETEPMNCDNCGLTQFEHIGFIPSLLMDGPTDSHYTGEEWVETENNIYWYKTAICTECGEMKFISPTEEDVEESEDRYLETLDNNGLLSGEDRERLLGDATR